MQNIWIKNLKDDFLMVGSVTASFLPEREYDQIVCVFIYIFIIILQYVTFIQLNQIGYDNCRWLFLVKWYFYN